MSSQLPSLSNLSGSLLTPRVAPNPQLVDDSKYTRHHRPQEERPVFVPQLTPLARRAAAPAAAPAYKAGAGEGKRPNEVCTVINSKEEYEGDDARDPSFKDWAPVVADATEFVTENMIGASSEFISQWRLIDFIRSRFAPVIKKFLLDHRLPTDSVHFIFKGGNVMRFIMHGLAERYNALLVELNNEYFSMFKSSDLDFGISFDEDAIRGKVRPEDAVEFVHHLSNRIEIEMKVIRDLFIATPTAYFPEIKLDTWLITTAFQKIKDQMVKTVEKFNVSPSGSGVKLPSIVNLRSLSVDLADKKENQLRGSVARNDMTIKFLDEDAALDFISKGVEGAQPQVVVCERVSKEHTMFVSNNQALMFRRNADNDAIHFDLVRLKLAMALDVKDDNGTEWTKRVGAEVIDVSLTHVYQNANPIPVFKTLNPNSTRNVKIYETYSLATLDDVPPYEVESYGLHSILYDLIRVIFIEIKYPWEDAKYIKRLGRIMGLLLCEAFMEIDDGIAMDDVRGVMEGCIVASPILPEEGTIWALVQKCVIKTLEAPESFYQEKQEFIESIQGKTKANLRMLTTHQQPWKLSRRVVLQDGATST